MKKRKNHFIMSANILVKNNLTISTSFVCNGEGRCSEVAKNNLSISKLRIWESVQFSPPVHSARE